MPDIDRRRTLPVAVDASVPLLHHDWIPRNLDVDHVLAPVVEIDALGRCIRRKEYSHGGIRARLGLERIYHGITLFHLKRAVQFHKMLPAVPTRGENCLEPRVRVHKLGEQDDSLVVELSARFKVLAKPFEYGLGLGVLLSRVRLCPYEQFVQHDRLFTGKSCGESGVLLNHLVFGILDLLLVSSVLRRLLDRVVERLFIAFIKFAALTLGEI